MEGGAGASSGHRYGWDAGHLWDVQPDSVRVAGVTWRADASGRCGGGGDAADDSCNRACGRGSACAYGDGVRVVKSGLGGTAEGRGGSWDIFGWGDISGGGCADDGAEVVRLQEQWG